MVLFWTVAAALGGTFVLGCGSGGGSGSSPPPAGPVVSEPTMAISIGGEIKLYTGLGDLANSGPAPVPAQTISAANVLSVAFDSSGDLYYLANNGTIGSDASFFHCTLPNAGLPFPPCTAVGGPIAGGKWLAIDSTGTVFATSLTGSTGTIVSFPSTSGPPSTPVVVYTSTALPALYGGIAVDGSNTVYVTELPALGATYHLLSCTAACQGSSGSQVDLTSSITASYPASPPGGPLAIKGDGTTLLVGAANTNPVALTALPIAFACAADGNGGLTCQPHTVSVPPLAGTDSPFVTTVGIAASHAGNVYDAALLTDGNTTDDPGPSFFGFDAAGAQFACSSTPSTCRVSQLPSVPVNSVEDSVPYGLAVSHAP